MTVQNVPNPLVHRVTLNPGNETRKAKTRLDEIFDEREERAAKRYSAAELEKMALEAENEAARLRGEPPKHKYGGGEVDEDKKKEEEEARKQQLMAQATALIEHGMEPEQVGRFLLGLPSMSGGAAQVTQGMTLKDVKEIIDMTTEKKEASELRSMISSLDKKIEELVKNPPHRDKPEPTDPVIFATQQAETLRIYHKTLDSLGMIPKPEPKTSDGRSLEVVKEEHRHDEKMEEIKADKEYKQNITEIATDIPERIGRGIAGQIKEEGGSSGGGRELESIICSGEGCGTRIFITPETGPQVICPKCSAIYQRKGTVETEVEQ